MKIEKRYKPELCVGKDSARPNIHHPYFDPKGKCVVATNGHGLVVVPVVESEDGLPGPAMYYHSTAFKNGRKLCGANAAFEIKGDGKSTLVDGSAFPVVGDGQEFPPYEKILVNYDQADDDVVRVTLNPKLLLALAQAMGVGPTDGVSLQFKVTDDGRCAKEPIVVTPDPMEVETNKAHGVLMPIILDDAPESVADEPDEETADEPDDSPPPPRRRRRSAAATP